MAFANNTANGITAVTTVYTPTGTTGTVIGMTVTPVSGSDTVVDVKLGTTCVVKALPIVVGTAATPIGGVQKLVVKQGQNLTVTATTAVDVVVSYLE